MTEKKRRNIRSQGIKAQETLREARGVDWTQRPWQELYALRDPLVREGLQLRRDSIGKNALDQPDEWEDRQIRKEEERWERVKPTAEAMESLGWKNSDIVWWILSGYQSETHQLDTPVFCDLLIQLAALIRERESFVPAVKKKSKRKAQREAEVLSADMNIGGNLVQPKKGKGKGKKHP